MLEDTFITFLKIIFTSNTTFKNGSVLFGVFM